MPILVIPSPKESLDKFSQLRQKLLGTVSTPEMLTERTDLSAFSSSVPPVIYRPVTIYPSSTSLYFWLSFSPSLTYTVTPQPRCSNLNVLTSPLLHAKQTQLCGLQVHQHPVELQKK